jgi:hypothetical protein
MYTKFYFMIIALVILFCSVGAAQRIREADLLHFFGCCVVDEGGINCSKFTEWRIVREWFSGKDSLNFTNGPKDNKWFYSVEEPVDSALILKNYEIGSRHSDLVFFILNDFAGWEYQQNLLTVWERISKDSLSFNCAQAGPFDTSIGSARIKGVRYFPDNSILLMLFKGGVGYAEYCFLRGKAPCDFGLFYSKGWGYGDEDSFVPHWEYSYDFDKINKNCGYKSVELARFYNADSLGTVSLDSAKSRIIDLWQLAKDFYKIEDIKK